MKILIGVTGSVAATLIPKLYEYLLSQKHQVKFVITERSSQFQFIADLQKLQFIADLQKFNNDRYYNIYCDEHEFYSETNLYKEGNPIQHISLREWADVLLICPATANTMAKMANGICDNLLTSVFRAWDFNKPVYVAPAMNAKMFSHPSCEEHINKLKSWKVKIIYPTTKLLECKEYGLGALADIYSIADIVGGEQWNFPLLLNYKRNDVRSFVPRFPHPGAFGSIRKYEVHTGVDLYCNYGCSVLAAQDGVVTDISPFTGSKAESPWWNDTWSVSIKGKSGIICYGEIEPAPNIKIGDNIEKGSIIGHVITVLKHPPKEPILGHSMNMLHVELLRADSQLPNCPLNKWKLNEKRPAYLLDPTPYLMLC